MRVRCGLVIESSEQTSTSKCLVICTVAAAAVRPYNTKETVHNCNGGPWEKSADLPTDVGQYKGIHALATHFGRARAFSQFHIPQL